MASNGKDREVDVLTHYEVGAHVSLIGTGKWYQGQTLAATVEDIRAEDDTVKVRYADGGYKRFPRSHFEQLLTPAPQLMAFLADNQFDLLPETHEDLGVTMEMTELHDQIMASVAAKDFLKAHQLKEDYRARAAEHDEQKRLRAELMTAIAGQDYLQCHEVQQRIEAHSAKRSAPAGGAHKPQFGDKEWLAQVGKKALGGGLSGAGAMVLQVSTLMWMRTIMNYQYRYGTNFQTAAKTLYAEGGLRRFYMGYTPALIQGPFSRFGDTFANAGVLALFESSESLKNTYTPVKTIFASGMAAGMRVMLTPVDTVKTMMQVEGSKGMDKLRAKYRAGGIPVFYHGAMATSAASFLGHYPWFVTSNVLQARVPVPDGRAKKLMRNAGIGFCATLVSDTTSNSLRVVKTYRQTNSALPYAECVKEIVAQDGYMGLFGRGLKTRLAANGVQGAMFSVCYKLIEEKMRA